jgi:tetratricopeptide (TPR) repeat protein
LVAAPLVYFSGLRPDNNQEVAAALQLPQITIVEFSGPPAEEVDAPMVAGLAIELVTDLEQFGSIEVRYGGTTAAPETADRANSFVLTGAVQPDGDLVSYVATLTPVGGDTPVWSKTISVPRADASRPTILDELSRSFSMVLGSYRGPLHALAREQAAAGHTPVGPATLYSCRVLFHLYRDRGGRDDAARAERCIADLPEEDRVSSSALAMGASLAVEAIDASTDESTRAQIYQSALNDLNLALEASPVSSFVWEQRARLEESRGDFAQARSFYNSALQLNPANNNGMAAFGRLLAFQGATGEERSLALEALTGSPDPPPWYYGGPAVLALLDEDFALAQSHAEAYAAADTDIGSVLAVVAAQGAGQSAAVERFLPRVLGSRAFREAGILPQLQQRLGDPRLLEIIRDGLFAAGVPATALDQPF